jgi:hypothetical protein
VRRLQRTLEGRIRVAGRLIAAGLVVQLGTLFWNHALSFILFTSVGALLTSAGVLLYLHTLATRPPSELGGEVP